MRVVSGLLIKQCVVHIFLCRLEGSKDAWIIGLDDCKYLLDTQKCFTWNIITATENFAKLFHVKQLTTNFTNAVCAYSSRTYQPKDSSPSESASS